MPFCHILRAGIFWTFFFGSVWCDKTIIQGKIFFLPLVLTVIQTNSDKTFELNNTFIVKFIPVNLCLLLVAEANIFRTLQGNAGNAIRDLTS